MMNPICYETQLHSEVRGYINQYRISEDLTLPYDCQFCDSVYTIYKKKMIIDLLIEQYKKLTVGLTEVDILQIILCYSNEYFFEQISHWTWVSLYSDIDVLRKQEFHIILMQYELLNYCSIPLGRRRRSIYRYFRKFFKMNSSDVNMLIYELFRRDDILMNKNYIETNSKTPEDKYYYLVETYYIPDRWLKEIFGLSNDSLDYIKKKYKKGVTSPKGIFRDAFLSFEIKRLFIAYVPDQVCVINGQRLLSTKPDIISVLLKSYLMLGTDVRSLYLKYKATIEFYINSDELVFVDMYAFKIFLRKLPFVLWLGPDKFRYCELTIGAIDSMFLKINFEKYHNTDISSKLLYQDNRPLFEKLGLSDYVEVYYLLMNHKDKIKAVEVAFKDNFIISFGTVDIDRQILFILRLFKSLEVKEFLRLYEEFYGVDIQTLSLYKLEIDKYRINDKLYWEKEEILNREENKNLVIDREYSVNLTNEEIDKLEPKLDASIYSLDWVRMLFKSVVGYPWPSKLTVANLELLGYEMMEDFVYKAKFKIIDEAIYTYLDQVRILDITQNDKTLLQHDKFQESLKEFCSNFRLIEFEPDLYISLRQLEENGITKDDLYNYIDSVELFSNRNCFTIDFQKRLGFKNKLNSLGYSNYFYESILKCSKRFEYAQIGNTTLFCNRDESITLFNLIEEIVFSFKSITICDLVRLIRQGYGIEITETQVVALLKRKRKTDIFYSKQREKLYRDFDTYDEEV